MKRRLRKMLIALLMLALLGGGALAASYGAQVLPSSMPVYAAKSTSAAKLGSLSQGTSFTVTAISGDWARISYKNRTGYARMRHILFDKHISAVAVKDTKLTFWTEASRKRGVQYRATLAAGTRVYVVGMAEGRLLVTNDTDSALGYVSASVLVKN